jgi:oxygen-independent coproporphyrinogen-3 oxidase
MMKGISGIYVHLPFCSIHCNYCDFPVSTQISLAPKYYLALLQEIVIRPMKEKADTLYFGGGTPSLTPVPVLKKIREQFVLTPNAEITVEANPEDINPDAIAGWIIAGINRLSLGIQSLQEPVLQSASRVHTADKALRSLEQIHASGFTNVNVDLMIGLPEQTVSGFLADLQRVIDLRPAHFSLYLLEIHDRTALNKEIQSGNRSVMKEEDQLSCYVEGIRLLQQAGFEHYEVSNFALPGFQCKHNLKYWNGDPYEGYGIGACSYLGSYRTQNVRELSRYMERISSNRNPFQDRTEEDRETKMRNRLIFGLRKRAGIDTEEFEDEFGLQALNLFRGEAGTLLQEGLLEISGKYLRLSQRGMLISNEILSLVV